MNLDICMKFRIMGTSVEKKDWSGSLLFMLKGKRGLITAGRQDLWVTSLGRIPSHRLCLMVHMWIQENADAKKKSQ